MASMEDGKKEEEEEEKKFQGNVFFFPSLARRQRPR